MQPLGERPETGLAVKNGAEDGGAVPSLEALGEGYLAALGPLRVEEAGAETRARKGWDRGDGGHQQKQAEGRQKRRVGSGWG